ncbi:MAG: Magnesium and cobalt efflux protein CorC [Candidatus Accumulibacter regalis]|uniref:Magnesium and cobalt efflux protein CorC n=1 Tax=Accumulibacter regalis TaxID=522306 RepID=A0A011Q7W2_ACCRE|nr:MULTISPECIES: hemolysin family protein [unclassified Candidatus Accumulibacter]EXI85327.1 MAG: Magnesium and cobalt efflux protein CorC [Candidatus Accumulibacter regalis]MQM33695.1 HlyC/CorC family transporter [Candidatus Accumulibacter phosphatis]MBL8367442.1 HlyC/CorC family transporter [Accumulibacter sp.]MBN8514111.1 HlyC/CorC family transporter [Accumulibacter sp.]HRE71170.1 hemolysin family protein [Accumulibacter sp.]
MSEAFLLLIMLAVSAFFSGSETALTSLSRARTESLLAERRLGAKALHRMKSNLNRTLVIILIGNNLVNTATATLATVVATEHFGHLGPGLAVGGITLLLLVFGEITPKTYASRYAIVVALLAAKPLEVLGKLLFPLVWALETLIHWMHSLTSPPKDPSVTESELIALAAHGTEEGSIEAGEHLMIRRIFDFSTLRASDIMVHRHQIFSLDGNRAIRSALDEIIASSHYRIPLHSGNPEEINHVITLQTVLREVAQGNLDKPLKDIGSDPLFVPPNQPIDSLLDVLKADKERLMVVVNEFGALLGIFTLEDVLEELVGDIYDDQEAPRGDQALLMKPGGNELVVDGTTELRVLEGYFGQELSGKPYDSANLWIITHLERIPAAGECVVLEGLEVKIERASRRRIHEVRIRRRPTVASGAEGKEPAGKESDSNASA